MNSPPSQQNGISYSEFIIEVILPFGEQYQFECHSRATVDYVKNKIFKTHCSGFKGDKSEYVLQLSETKEFLFVEFLRFLSTDALKQRATAGLPIEVRLVTRDAIYDTREADSPVIRRLSKQGSHTNLLELFAKQSKSAVPLSSGKETGVSNKFHLPLASLKDQPPLNEEWNSPPKGPRRRSSSITLQTSGLLEYHNIPNHALERTNPFKNSSKISSPKQSSAIAITNSENRDFCKTVLVEKRYSLPNSATFAPQWANESLSTVIEPNSMGYHTEVGDYGLPVAKFVPKIFEIEMPLQENLYEKYFLGNEHFNFIGNPENVGPVVVSLLRDKNLLRALIRVSEKTHHICTEEYTSDSVFFRLKWKSWLKSVLGKTSLCIPIKSLKKVKGQAIIQDILAFDQSHLVTQLKFGVLYCKDGQVTEDEWFGNEHGSSAFNEFLELLGERITLKGWDKFRAGLDTKTDTTGIESIYTQYGNLEIMFHVSTLLPFSEADQQKIERKRHLGNDIVVVIFMDGKTKFPPTACKSFFNHIYIVVQQDPKFENYYRVGVTIKDGVRQFGPSFPYPPLIHKDMIRDFLMTKMINGEWATYRSTEFAQKFKRTRNQQLGHLVSQY